MTSRFFDEAGNELTLDEAAQHLVNNRAIRQVGSGSWSYSNFDVEAQKAVRWEPESAEFSAEIERRLAESWKNVEPDVQGYVRITGWVGIVCLSFHRKVRANPYMWQNTREGGLVSIEG